MDIQHNETSNMPSSTCARDLPRMSHVTNKIEFVTRGYVVVTEGELDKTSNMLLSLCRAIILVSCMYATLVYVCWGLK